MSSSDMPIARVDSSMVYPRLLSSARIPSSLSWTHAA